jgi:hypothetical protein
MLIARPFITMMDTLLQNQKGQVSQKAIQASSDCTA